MSYIPDSKAHLVDALRSNTEDFELSNLIFKNGRAVKAVYQLYELKADLLKFAHDPLANPLTTKPPDFPDLTGLNEEDRKRAMAAYNEIRQFWETVMEANELRVSLSDYHHVVDYLSKYFRALHSTPAIKGNRFYSFTKNAEQQQKGGGILGGLFRGKKDE